MAAYKHPEAFCLMRYRNERTNEIEVLWNSRDGVTPFTISSPDNTATMVHVDWSRDERRPDHVPAPGQRVFVTITIERARASAWNRLAVRGADLRAHFKNLSDAEIVDYLAKEYMEWGGGGGPVVITGAEYLAGLPKQEG